MKNFYLIALTIIFFSSTYAQKVEFSDHHDIVHFERLHNEKMLHYEKTTVGNMYDLKYHRFNWTINPAVEFISGAVTTYFTSTQENLTEITFDFISS